MAAIIAVAAIQSPTRVASELDDIVEQLLVASVKEKGVVELSDESLSTLAVAGIRAVGLVVSIAGRIEGIEQLCSESCEHTGSCR